MCKLHELCDHLKCQEIKTYLDSALKQYLNNNKDFVCGGKKYSILSYDLNKADYMRIETHYTPNELALVKYFSALYALRDCGDVQIVKPDIDGCFEFYNALDGQKYKATFFIASSDYEVNVEQEKWIFHSLTIGPCSLI